jgi:hypothetical protein
LASLASSCSLSFDCAVNSENFTVPIKAD